jgi:hypothetical protein
MMKSIAQIGQKFLRSDALRRRLLKRSAFERASVVGAITVGGWLLIVIGFWLWARVTGSVRLSDVQLAVALIFSLVVAMLGGVFGLISLLLGVPRRRSIWRDLQQKPRPHLARTLVLAGSLLTVIVALIFSLAVVRPKLQLAIFAQNLQNTCATPLSHIGNDLSAAGDAARQNTFSNQGFAAAMTKYAHILQQDAQAIPHDQAALRGLKSPDARFQRMVTACETELQSLGSFIGDSDSVTLPQILPAPLGGMQMSAQALLQTSAEIAQGAIAGVPEIPAFLLSPMVSSLLNLTQTSCDATCQQLKSDGASLQDAAYAPFQPQEPVVP